MYGVGIVKGLGITLRHFFDTLIDDFKWFGKRNGLEAFQTKQGLKGKGMFTVQYPEEKIAVPERFRFIPFLVTYNEDDPEYPGKDWCTSCGICAKVCPPQCIWIVRGTDATTGRPKPEPEQFFIDIDICMNCGYCAEYCPFDAIRMDHDYELASYDRTTKHIYDKEKLSKPISYWQAIAPTTAAEEQVARGGYDHTDVQKTRKKAGLPASRPGPISEKPEVVPVTAAVAAPTAVAEPAQVVATAPAQTAPTAGAATTAEGKPIVRRRGAAGAVAKPAEGSVTPPPAATTPAPLPPTPLPPAPVAAQPVVAPTPVPAPVQPAASVAPAESAIPADAPKPATVVRRRNNPPPKKD